MGEKTLNMGRFVSWICGTCMILGSASSPEPSVTHCELLEHANITCYWSAVSSEGTSYKLSVNMTHCLNYTNYISMGSCNTTHTHCSVRIGSVSHCFCVDVLASSPSGAVRSDRHCLVGINEVKMYPPRITSLAIIPGKAHCLKLEWVEDSYPLYEKDLSVLQIEYSTPHQARSWTARTALHNRQMELCGLYPGTKHYVRIRAQSSRAPKHWSSWSAFQEATTAEAAPSAAPELWRHIQPVDEKGERRITLLWKPLQWPGSNGEVVRYNASCWSDLNWTRWKCDYLYSSNTSCVLSVSAQPCTCSLTASNSAGTSPSAHVHIPGDGDRVLLPPLDISVTPLEDFQLKVNWTAALEQSGASFVVQWFAIPDNTGGGIYWKILNESSRSFILTDGVLPEIPYNVSVQVVYRKAVTAARFAIAFTRQGDPSRPREDSQHVWVYVICKDGSVHRWVESAFYINKWVQRMPRKNTPDHNTATTSLSSSTMPSIGPTLEVMKIAGDRVMLKWETLPLEKLHGFIQNYTILYKTNDKVQSRVLGSDHNEFTLSGLPAGKYNICVRVHTEAGGAAGPWVSVTVGNDYVELVAILLCTVGALLILVILLSQVERIQQHICPAVPDPSKSSLSTWPPVSQRQHLLTVLDFKPSPSLFELIYVGGKTGHWDHHHQDHSQVCAYSYQSAPTKSVSHESKSHSIFQRPVEAKTDKREAEQRLSELNAEEFSEDLTADLDCRSKIVAKEQSCPQTQPSFSYPTVSTPCLGMSVIDPPLCGNCVSRLDSCSQMHVSSRSSSDPRSSLGVDAVDLVYNRTFRSSLDSSCYPLVSASYLPVSECYASLGVEAEDSANLIQGSNLLSALESHCYTHVSTTYLPVPGPAVAYADFVLERMDTSEPVHQTSSMSKMQPQSHSHVAFSCVPVPVPHADLGMKAAESSSNQQVSLSPSMSTDFTMVDTYRLLGPDECPLLLQFPPH